MHDLPEITKLELNRKHWLAPNLHSYRVYFLDDLGNQVVRYAEGVDELSAYQSFCDWWRRTGGELTHP
jgi:hypothetical protein